MLLYALPYAPPPMNHVTHVQLHLKNFFFTKNLRCDAMSIYFIKILWLANSYYLVWGGEVGQQG